MLVENDKLFQNVCNHCYSKLIKSLRRIIVEKLLCHFSLVPYIIGVDDHELADKCPSFSDFSFIKITRKK